jgi:hypothetical protein
MSVAWAAPHWTLPVPTTVVTNLVIAAQCVVLTLRLLPRSRSDLGRPWVLFFACMSVAALAGAVKHGYPPETWQAMGFGAVVVSNTAIAVAAAFAERVTVRTVFRRGRVRAWLQRGIFAQAGVVCVWTLLRPGFLPALVSAVAGLTPVLVAESFRALRGRPGARAIAAGFALTAGSGFIYVLGISLAPWIGPIDLAHLSIVASLALIYRGVSERTALADVIDGREVPARAAAGEDGPSWSWLRT